MTKIYGITEILLILSKTEKNKYTVHRILFIMVKVKKDDYLIFLNLM